MSSSFTSAKLIIATAALLEAAVVQSARYASCSIEEDYRGSQGIYGQLVLKEEDPHETTGRRLMTVSGVVHGTNSNT